MNGLSGLGKLFHQTHLEKESVTSGNGGVYKMLLWTLQTIFHSAPDCGPAATGEFISEKK